MIENVVHERGVDGIDGRGHVEGLRGLATLDIADGLADPAAEAVVNDKAWVLTHSWRRLVAALEVLARERGDDEPAGAREFRHDFVQGDAADHRTEFHGGPPGAEATS